MDYVIGIALALVTSAFAAMAGFDRDRAFYPTLLVAIDAIHGHLVMNPGVPAWWPSFCLAYDVTAAGVLVCLVRHRLALKKEPW